jgi:ubiquinone/menaquinone biosynthesis C-methylase UbiE
MLAMNVGDRMGSHLRGHFNVATFDLKGYDLGNRELPYSDELFHLVVQGRPFDYFYYDADLVHEIYRVTAKSGRYISYVNPKPAGASYKKRTPDGRWREYSIQTYLDLVRGAGFRPIFRDMSASDDFGATVVIGVKEEHASDPAIPAKDSARGGNEVHLHHPDQVR